MTVRVASQVPLTAATTGLVERAPRPPVGVDWKLEQRWERVLFCHFRYPKSVLQPLVPAGLDVEERDGSAWVSVVPLHATHTHLNHCPELLFLSEFAEVNLRTYVRDANGDPGVYFLSIDIHNLVFATAARELFHVPYHDAEVRMVGDEIIQVTSDRDGAARCEMTYRPDGDLLVLAPGSLEEYLCERYALYVEHDGELRRGIIQHQSWELYPAQAEIACDELMEAAGLPAPDADPWAFYSPQTLTHVWPLASV